jgi:hypothetical protein
MQLEQELPAPGYNGYLDAIALCQQTCGSDGALKHKCIIHIFDLCPFKV